MDIESKLARGYREVQGGLFSKVTKADVGDGFAAMAQNRVTLMGWADPFYPDASLPDVVKEALLETYTSGFASHYTMPIGTRNSGRRSQSTAAAFMGWSRTPRET